MILTSRNNPLIKETAALKEKKGRKEQGFFLVEGVKMVSECKRSGLEIGRTFVSESYRGETDENAICVSDEVFAFLSDEKTPQGILCSVRIPKPSLCPPKESCLLLDGVSDPGNMGAIIRTANAAGYGEIYLVGCTDPYSPKSVRASMSGIFFVRIYTGTREAVLEALSGLPILAADMDGENIFSFRPPEKFALAIGNEANGISEEVFRKAQHKLKIPMRAAQESLNAGIAAGIAMYLWKKDKFTDMERS
ncbi:MAG: TrmH family RNA methyltransferase [Christensenellaceae bacterium]